MIKTIEKSCGPWGWELKPLGPRIKSKKLHDFITNQNWKALEKVKWHIHSSFLYPLCFNPNAYSLNYLVLTFQQVQTKYKPFNFKLRMVFKKMSSKTFLWNCLTIYMVVILHDLKCIPCHKTANNFIPSFVYMTKVPQHWKVHT